MTNRGPLRPAGHETINGVSGSRENGQISGLKEGEDFGAQVTWQEDAEQKFSNGGDHEDDMMNSMNEEV